VPIISQVKRRYDSYEVEIIVSLGLLILFLISINFISGYSFENARHWQMMQFEKDLYLAADCAVAMLQGDIERIEYSAAYMQERLHDISIRTGINDIAFVDTLGRTVAGNAPDGSRGSPLPSLRARKPLTRKDGKVLGYISLSSSNAVGESMRKLSRWDVIFRIGGLLSALVVGSFFLKAILLPYRRIKNEAMDFNLDLVAPENKAGIEYVVDTFKDVIAELEEKKSRLEIMYHSSEKRADSLARYNEYILGSITSGVIICDSNGIVTRFNKSAQNILQHLEIDCRGKHFSEVFGAQPKLVSMLNDALRRKTVHSRLEFEIKRQDGKKLWLGCSSSMINDEKGEGMGAALLLVDLTEIRRLQEASSYSEKMIALGETAAGLAHEVRNSFAAILGFANLLRKIAPDQQSASQIEAIRDEALSAESLMTRFLSFARPLELHAQPIIMQELMESALKHLSHPGLARIQVKTDYPHEPANLYGDPALLRQALSNLLLNACDALPNGGEIKARVIIEKRENQKESGEIVITITDNGVGIAPEISSRIFDPFFSGKPGGTGLGLALVKKIVVLHGGRVEIRSKPGKGTRFTIHLPATTDFPADQDTESKAEITDFEVTVKGI
jgi:PAS domain S-box-containing protein